MKYAVRKSSRARPKPSYDQLEHQLENVSNTARIRFKDLKELRADYENLDAAADDLYLAIEDFINSGNFIHDDVVGNNLIDAMNAIYKVRFLDGR